MTNFIAQFEDELVRIWDKPKFVHDMGYLCSVSTLEDEIIEKVLKHSNFNEQIYKWKTQKAIVDDEEINRKYKETDY